MCRNNSPTGLMLHCSPHNLKQNKILLSGGKLPAGDVPVSGQHDSPRAQDPLHRGTVRHAAGLHHPPRAAQDLPRHALPDQTSLTPPTHTRV
jgi:hypothetical protein